MVQRSGAAYANNNPQCLVLSARIVQSVVHGDCLNETPYAEPHVRCCERRKGATPPPTRLRLLLKLVEAFKEIITLQSGLFLSFVFELIFLSRKSLTSKKSQTYTEEVLTKSVCTKGRQKFKSYPQKFCISGKSASVFGNFLTLSTTCIPKLSQKWAAILRPIVEEDSIN